MQKDTYVNSKHARSKSRSWNKFFHEQLKDQREAGEYLKYCFEQGSDSFLLALHHVIDAWGGVGKLAKESGLNRESLYKLFRGDRGARLSTIITVLQTLGIEISFEMSSPKKRKRKLVGSKAA